MKISKKNKKLILDEMEYILNEMKKSGALEEKLFLFSGIHAVVHRVFNIEYDPHLVFVHFVLSNVHSGFSQKLDAIRKGDPIITVDAHQIEKIEDYTHVLKEKFEEEQPLNDILRKFIELLYSTTGNGFYLKRKGWMET